MGVIVDTLSMISVEMIPSLNAELLHSSEPQTTQNSQSLQYSMSHHMNTSHE